MSDPTAIDITWDPNDPRGNWMSGIARHGRTPFEVPYISQIDETLWTGGCTNGLVLPTFIDHVVSLYPWEAYRETHELKSKLAVRLYDAAGAVDMEQYAGIARWVNQCRASGPTLVHCQAGLNRSGLVAGLALVLDGMTPADAISLLREKRSPAVLCNPSFVAALETYEG